MPILPSRFLSAERMTPDNAKADWQAAESYAERRRLLRAYLADLGPTRCRTLADMFGTTPNEIRGKLRSLQRDRRVTFDPARRKWKAVK